MEPYKFQRNAIYRAVAAGGLDAAECDFAYDEAEWRVTHAPSGSYLLIRSDLGDYTSTPFVGDFPGIPSKTHSWPSLMNKVEQWAEDVTLDVETPDLWAELRRAPGVLTGGGYEDGDNRPFTPDEQAEIFAKLGEIKELVERSDTLSEQQKLSVEAKLDGLGEAAGGAGRRDWALMFGGVILGLILQQLAPPDVVSNIVDMANNGLKHLFAGDGPVPPLPPLAPPRMP